MGTLRQYWLHILCCVSCARCKVVRCFDIVSLGWVKMQKVCDAWMGVVSDVPGTIKSSCRSKRSLCFLNFQRNDQRYNLFVILYVWPLGGWFIPYISHPTEHYCAGGKEAVMQLIQLHGIDPIIIIPAHHFLSKREVDPNTRPIQIDWLKKPCKETAVSMLSNSHCDW